MTKLITNQNGSALTLMLLLLPIFLSMGALIVAGFLVIREQKQADYICRNQLLLAQKNMLLQMQKLQDLNPEATELRAERQIAQAEVEASAEFPPALAAALEHLNSVILRQEALSEYQQNLITMANFKAVSDVQSTSSQLRSTALKKSISVYKTNVPQLAVLAEPPGDLTPNYETDPQISQKQQMQIAWSFEPALILPEWIKLLLEPKSFKLSSECSSVPKSQSKLGGASWFAALSRAKPLWN
jgi:hypothetical protein